MSSIYGSNPPARPHRVGNIKLNNCYIIILLPKIIMKFSIFQ